MLPFAARPRVLPPVGEVDDTSPPAADDPYALSAGVGRDAPNRRDDVLRVETVLSRLGRFDTTPTGGPPGYPGMRLVESLTGLQKDHGLTVDGRALPGGETLGAMRTEDVARGGQVKPAVYRTGEASATSALGYRSSEGQVGNPDQDRQLNDPSRTTAQHPISPPLTQVDDESGGHGSGIEKHKLTEAEWADNARVYTDGSNVELNDVLEAGAFGVEALAGALAHHRLPRHQKREVWKRIRALQRSKHYRLGMALDALVVDRQTQLRWVPSAMSVDELNDAIEDVKSTKRAIRVFSRFPLLTPTQSRVIRVFSRMISDQSYQDELARRRQARPDPLNLFQSQ